MSVLKLKAIVIIVDSKQLAFFRCYFFQSIFVEQELLKLETIRQRLCSDMSKEHYCCRLVKFLSWAFTLKFTLFPWSGQQGRTGTEIQLRTLRWRGLSFERLEGPILTLIQFLCYKGVGSFSNSNSLTKLKYLRCLWVSPDCLQLPTSLKLLFLQTNTSTF